MKKICLVRNVGSFNDQFYEFKCDKFIDLYKQKFSTGFDNYGIYLTFNGRHYTHHYKNATCERCIRIDQIEKLFE